MISDDRQVKDGIHSRWQCRRRSALASAARRQPPISACEELVNKPKPGVNKFQDSARQSAISTLVHHLDADSPPPIVLATAVPNTNAATNSQMRRQTVERVSAGGKRWWRE
jgi:hypothetical protein